tara:strand:- start:62 stop:406 length:345 start_codon:yes stop_codon:yes gene_type:complete
MNKIFKIILIVFSLNTAFVSAQNPPPVNIDPSLDHVSFRSPAQEKRELVNFYVRLGQLLVGLGLAIRLGQTVMAVVNGEREARGYVTGWLAVIGAYIVVFEVVIKTWIYHFISL